MALLLDVRKVLILFRQGDHPCELLLNGQRAVHLSSVCIRVNAAFSQTFFQHRGTLEEEHSTPLRSSKRQMQQEMHLECWMSSSDISSRHS